MTCKPPESYSDPHDVAQLAEPLRSRIAQAINDAPNGGLALVSGKRTDWMQWLLRHDRCPGHECDPAYKGHPTTALPGRSNHRNLDAAHCAADMGGGDLDWLIANESSYGLARTVPGEKWHFEPRGTPNRPIAPYGQPPIEGDLIVNADDEAKIKTIVEGALDARLNPDGKGNLLVRLRDAEAIEASRTQRILVKLGLVKPKG